MVWLLKTPLKSSSVGYLYMLASGVLTSLFNYLFFEALSHGQVEYGGTMVAALSPLFTYVMSIAVFGTKVSTRQITALSVGVLGALILLRVPYDGFAFLSADSSYFLWCAIVWSAITVIAQIGAHRTAVFMFIVPVGAILSSMVVYDESIAASTLVGCALAFLAVVLFNYSKLSKTAL